MALLYSPPIHIASPAISMNNKLTNPMFGCAINKRSNLPARGPHFARKNTISSRLIPLVDSIAKKAIKTVTHETVKTAQQVLQAGQEVIDIVDGLAPAIYTPPADLKREDFPADFLFGASTSALQTEGSGTEGGRGPSTWDFMIKADKGMKAVDSYNLYKEDVKLLKQMGMNTYRMSISWTRILPQGTVESGINQEGIDFYNKLIDELIANGITPIVTLFHFDIPVPIQSRMYGFMRPNIIQYFTEFADICFEKFGDRVKYWGTINEPSVFGSYGYKIGLPSDMQNDPMGSYIATHHIILTHAATVKLYREKYQKEQGGQIGISLPSKWYMPHSTDPKDFAGTEVQMDFNLGWYMDPLVNGDYPAVMKENIKGLPEFTREQKEMVKGAFDYIGINYYTARFVKQTCTVDAMKGTLTIQYSELTEDDQGNKVGEQAQGQPDIWTNPDGLRDLLLYVKTKYNNPLVYITENGVPATPTLSDSVPNLIAKGNKAELEAAFYDDYRIQHLEDHLISVREAMKEGANIKGYIVWTLMDNMEVGAGYDCRFGLNFTDYYDNHKRYPKKSAKWVAKFLQPVSTKQQQQQTVGSQN